MESSTLDTVNVVTAFGLKFKDDQFIDKKIEMLRAALTTPSISEKMFNNLYRKLTQNEYDISEVLHNIKVLEVASTPLTGDKLCTVVNRIQRFMNKHLLKHEELKTLIKSRSELIEVFGYKTVKNSRDFYDYLCNTVYGQEHALKKLCLWMFQWNSFWNRTEQNEDQIAPPPCNAKLLVGGTGTGKTFMTEQIAKITNTKLIRIDAASLVCTGYVGKNIGTEIVSGMVANGYQENENLRFIVFIDEFDKLTHSSSDIKGHAVLNEILCILDSKTISGTNSYEKNADSIKVSLKTVVFVFAGSFGKLTQKQNNEFTGFNSSQKSINSLQTLDSESIIKYGIPREIMSRLSTPIFLNNTTIDSLTTILYESPQGLKYFESLFEAEKIPLCVKDFEPELKIITQKAFDMKLGNRAIFQLVNDFFDNKILELEYSL